jgi:hypothetical protein
MSLGTQERTPPKKIGGERKEREIIWRKGTKRKKKGNIYQMKFYFESLKPCGRKGKKESKSLGLSSGLAYRRNEKYKV